MAAQANASLSLIKTTSDGFSQLTTFYDQKYNLAWYFMHTTPRQCFTTTLLTEINRWFSNLREELHSGQGRKISYIVLASDVPGVFNLGGDLSLFKRHIELKNREALFEYAKICVDAMYANMSITDCDVTTISLVQGDALGGGFEAALSSEVLIAERGSKMGLPEVLFNLFPGMGAYSILSRKIGDGLAQRMILGGKLYSAEELYDMGVVDVLVDEGAGEMAVYDYVAKENRSRNAYRAFRKARKCCNPVSYEELMNIAEVWVDAALQLDRRDIRMMERLVARQTQKVREGA